jgi:alpha-tubulin suppressor-like RCC1 family protein
MRPSNVPVQVQGLTGAVAVPAGYQHSLALLSDGTVMAWGDNGFNQLGQSDGIGGIQSSNVPVQVRVASPAAGTLWTVGAQETQGQCCLRPLALTTSSG